MMYDCDDEPGPEGCPGDNGTGCLNVAPDRRCVGCRWAEITVCAECLTASCWHGEFMCEGARDAGTTTRTRAQLDTLGLEAPSRYSAEKIARVEGRPR